MWMRSTFQRHWNASKEFSTVQLFWTIRCEFFYVKICIVFVSAGSMKQAFPLFSCFSIFNTFLSYSNSFSTLVTSGHGPPHIAIIQLVQWSILAHCTLYSSQFSESQADAYYHSKTHSVQASRSSALAGWSAVSTPVLLGTVSSNSELTSHLFTQ